MEITIRVKRTSNFTHIYSKSLNTKLAFSAVCHECLNAKDINVPNSPFSPPLAFFLLGSHYPGLNPPACGLIEVSPPFLCSGSCSSPASQTCRCSSSPSVGPSHPRWSFLLSGLTLSFHLEWQTPSLSDTGSPRMLHFLSCHFPLGGPYPCPLPG